MHLRANTVQPPQRTSKTSAARLLPFVLGVLAAACSSEEGDAKTTTTPTVLGDGERIRDVGDPAARRAGAKVYISGAQVLAIDTFDETKNGSSAGTIYVQDPGSAAPYSGISLYKPAFVPSNLRIAPGDVLDLRGPYVELAKIGGAVFTPPGVLPQLDRPTATFRYEATLAAPVEIDVNDLNDYTKGRRWLDMLVTVRDVTLATPPSNDTSNSGRVTAKLIPGGRDVPTLSNELFDVPAGSIPAGTKLQSLTGIVTWFFSFHIAPRSPDDIVRSP
ncbi:hypothetical protein [Pendulispora albinea]|uniref:DUF5689 domain-containing protein n=1 Tax=Pendulispora albinea TaxID=2741071 RepID=A0ABZ2LP22_9BACT